MSGITLAIAQSHLEAWMAADISVAKGQSYEIGGRKLSRADAGEITEKINLWNTWCVRLGGGRKGGNRVQRIIPLDL